MNTTTFFAGVFLVLILLSCSSEPKQVSEEKTPDAVSLSGAPLFSAEPSAKLLDRLAEKRTAYEQNPNDPDALIWFARFVAYSGDYAKALTLYAKGIEQFPDDARMYRHRGHRYISIRKFDEAIADFKKAVELIEGKENEIEPDGMPNAKGIPVSTLHGNIWYHLGLAYYLKHDFPNALAAYQQCLATSTSPDNVVSASNWLYMISRRMNDETAAKAYMEGIDAEIDIIENFNYHFIDLFYKGEMSLEELSAKAAEPGSGADAINYAIGNWHLYHGEKDKAKTVFEKILEGKGWASFGFIAAEKDWVESF